MVYKREHPLPSYSGREFFYLVALHLIWDEVKFLSASSSEEDYMYKKVSTDLNFVDREKAVEKFWKENHIFEKSMENRKEGRRLPTESLISAMF